MEGLDLSSLRALYVAGGYDGRECRGDVWASVDGARWTRARVLRSFIARAFWFLYARGVAIGGLTTAMTTTVGRFVSFSRAGRF